jgi:hypothetical protein
MKQVWRGPHAPLDNVHRVGAIVFALGLWVFGFLGLANRLEPFSTVGVSILGLSSNGLLSVISLVVGAILIVAAARGGRTASTVTVVVGAAFLLSGLLNVLVLETPLNLLAFRMSNVIFSLVSGGLLMFLGSYGRFTGRLPDDNPYRRPGTAPEDAAGLPEPVYFSDPDDVRAVRELAEAARALALGTASPVQRRKLQAIETIRRPEDRVRAWRTAET